ncbi:hypothetical protein CVIRNUC_005046 [Coccomyxa viridis]|uniref:MHD2 domain-containing protein n=1 Tax=Coccomyxa viridis TaxID=1274662 RepID=A0AAV1I424_9CHLO|nr:hypothetical protein CVIRNUC_005046 [Coccomyxa viridis]
MTTVDGITVLSLDGRPQDPSLPLTIPELEDDSLQQLAYTLFCAYCGPHTTPSIKAYIQEQLQITDVEAADTDRALHALLNSSRLSSVASLQLLVRLLHNVRPDWLSSFAAFHRWQATVLELLSRMLHWSTTAYRLNQVGANRWEYDHAKLEGAFRRLAVPDSSQYDEEAYSEALTDCLEAIKRFIMHTRLGWKFSWGVRVRMAELLLPHAATSFGQAPLLGLREQLAEHLWPALGVTAEIQDALQPFIFFQQFWRTGDLALLEQVKQLIPRLTYQQIQDNPFADGASADMSEDAQDIVPLVVDSILSFCCAQLCDFTSAFAHGTRMMKGVIEVLRIGLLARGDPIGIAQVLEDCVAKSMQAACKRLAGGLIQARGSDMSTEERLLAAAKGVDGLFEDIVEQYTPVLVADVFNAVSLAAEQLYRMLLPQISAWLAQGLKLNQQSMDLMRALLLLEDRLCAAMEFQPAEPWGLMAALEPALFKWTIDKLELLQGWMQRLMSDEAWKPVTKPQGCARSCVETMKIADETLDALFDMELPLPRPVVRSLAEGIDTVLQKYVDALMQDVGSPASLKPPIPPLTRYKRDVVAKQQATDLEGAPRLGSTRPASLLHVNGKHKRNGSRSSSLPGTPTHSSDTLMQLTCRLSSLDYLLIRLPVLATSVRSRYDDSMKPAEGDGTPWLEGLFEGAQDTLQRAEDRVSAYMAAKVVYEDLRQPLLEDLYRHSVQQARLGPALEQLDDALGALCQATPKELHTGIGGALLATMVEALMRVLLHGGPCRWFIVDDMDMLEDDLQLLKSLFEAEGEGLSKPQIEELCAPLAGLLVTMQLDTGILMSNFKQATSKGRGQDPVIDPLGPANNPQTIVAILAHRADRSASKFLKKELSMPKTAEDSPKSMASFGTAAISFTRFKAKITRRH